MLPCFQYFSLQLYLSEVFSICIYCFSTLPIDQLDGIMFSLLSSILMPEEGGFFVDYNRVIGVHSTNGYHLLV